jgi:glycopeptide antibiotics resistance protein
MFWRYVWPALAWAVVILILCGFPGEKLPKLTFLQWLKPDKIAHLVLFGIQSYLLMRGFEKQNEYSFLMKNAVLSAIVLSVLFGCLVEVMQDTVFIQRSGDIRDAIANSLGALAGWWFYRKNFKVKTMIR